MFAACVGWLAGMFIAAIDAFIAGTWAAPELAPGRTIGLLPGGTSTITESRKRRLRFNATLGHLVPQATKRQGPTGGRAASAPGHTSGARDAGGGQGVDEFGV